MKTPGGVSFVRERFSDLVQLVQEWVNFVIEKNETKQEARDQSAANLITLQQGSSWVCAKALKPNQG